MPSTAFFCFEEYSFFTIINTNKFKNMKKSTLWSLALVALTLVSQGLRAQDCQFTPELFPGQAADRTAHEVNATATVGEGGFNNSQVGYLNAESVQTSNEAVVWASGRGAYFVGAGTADVTYSEHNRLDNCDSYHTIHYTVAKGTPVARFMMNGQEVTEYTAAFITGGGGAEGGIGEDGSVGGSSSGSTIRTPNYSLTIMSFNSGRISWATQAVSPTEITFASSNPAVATIDATGKVTVIGLGETTISFSWPGNDNWNGASASYVLKVKKPSSFYFSPMTVMDSVNEVTQRLPTMIYETVTITNWVSSNPDVATVDNQGNVTMLAEGNAQITATFEENDEYVGHSASYYLQVVKRQPMIRFASDFAETELGIPFTPVELINPFNVPINFWVSTDPTVADISIDGTTITPHKLGTTTIRATISNNPVYANAQAFYDLYVTTSGVTVMGVLITSENANDVLGNGKVSFDREHRILYLNDWYADVTGLSADIKANVILAERDITIILQGNCTITGAECCIAAPSSGLVIRSESKQDSLTLEANASTSAMAIRAAAIKVHEAKLFATGQNAAILCNLLSVTKNSEADPKFGHVHAKALGIGGIAIHCQVFEKGGKDVGRVDVLTPYVFWDETKKGFFNIKGVQEGGAAGKEVWEVEIGKIPLVVPEDEVTTISFTETDPDGNENVIFSADASNTFDDVTKQLVITTTLDEQVVADALDALVPGSSAWMALLPGSLTFDIPAGEGDIKVQCQTFPGYQLNLQIQGQAAVSITQMTPGEAIVHYNVANPVHVVIYLHANGGSTAPARIATRMEDAVTAGAYIQAVTIQPANAPLQPTAIDQVATPSNGSEKILRNGQLLILRDGKIFNAQGAQVR